jgi:serine/threonine protein kinase
MADRIGQQLGHYRLIRLVGKGAFAEVYLGEHDRMLTQSAVKVLHAQLASEEEARFQQEAHLVASLTHPHIVRVHDFAVQDGTPFLAMDFAPNGTLRERFPRGAPQAPGDILPYVWQVADALHYAHGQRLIHRDVKPENMLLDAQNQVLLSDFGIAVVLQSPRYKAAQEVMGTATYMAPEQIQARAIPASDQYALAVIVYEWLSGAPPFQGSVTEVMAKQLFTEPPRLRERVRALSPAVEAVVMGALSKDPADRFPSVESFVRAFEEACQAVPVLLFVTPSLMESTGSEEQTVTEPTPAPAAPEHAPALSALEALTASARPETAPAPEMPAWMEPVPTWTEPAPAAPAWERMMPVRPAEPPVSEPAPPAAPLPLQPMPPEPAWPESAFAAPPVSEPAPPAAPPISPDEPSAPGAAPYVAPIIVSAPPAPTWKSPRPEPGGGLPPPAFAVPSRPTAPPPPARPSPSLAAPSRPAAQPPAPTGLGATWREVDWIPSPSAPGPTPALHPPEPEPPRRGVSRRAVLLGGVVGLIAVGGGLTWLGVNALSTRLPRAASNTHPSPVPTHAPTAAPQGAALFTYRGHSGFLRSVAWSPGGTRIASAGDDNTAQVWDALTGAHPLTYKGHSQPVLAVAWSPDGTLIASGSRDLTVHVWDAQSARGLHTFSFAGRVTSLAWSPDGKYLAGGSWDETIHVWETSTWQRLRTFSANGKINALAWSPDNTHLVSGDSDNQAIIWNVATNSKTLTYKGHTSSVLALAWTPDGKAIASGGDTPDTTVHCWDSSSGKPLWSANTKDHTYSLAWSPKGDRLAAGGGSVYLLNPQTGSQLFTRQGDAWTLAWSPDGKDIASGGQSTTVQVWQAM